MEPTLVHDPITQKLSAVRLRRAELTESIALLEQALAVPADMPVVWGESVQLAVRRLATDLADHIDVTEGPGGLHENIVESSPRLSHAVTVLTDDHDELEAELAGLTEAAEAPVVEHDVRPIIEQAVRLVEHLVKHQQRGADLVYEAFEQDLGAGD